MDNQLQKLKSFLFDADSTKYYYEHWYDRGEHVEVRIVDEEDPDNHYFYVFATNDELSVRGSYQLTGMAAPETIVVELSNISDRAIDLRFRCLDDAVLQIKR